jgi:hypothetical protein
MRHVHLAAGLAASAALVLGACGATAEEKAFDELSATCTEQVGGTVQAATVALQGGYPVGPLCSTTLLAMSDTDACGAASAANEVCQVLYYWFSAEACQGGYCVCELRVLKQALDARQGSAPICAARFVRGQPSP